MSKDHQAPGLLDPSILFPAIRDAFVKLDPRKLLRNPVIFVTEIVAVVVTILFIRDLAQNPGEAGFSGQIAAWLWFTVLFATFAEAVAEGRGRAQADSLKKTKSELVARRLAANGKTETIPASSLKVGDIVLVAGKGHERGQEVAGVKHPFDDREVLAAVLAAFSLVTAFIFHHQLADPVQQIMFLKNLAIAGGFTIDAEDQIAWLQAGLLRGAVTVNTGHDNPGATVHAEGFRQLWGQWLYFDAQPAANHLTVLDNRLHHIHRQFHRDGKADALRAAGLGEDRGIDADQVAIGIHLSLRQARQLVGLQARNGRRGEFQ